jgi:hypothetical protein
MVRVCLMGAWSAGEFTGVIEELRSLGIADRAVSCPTLMAFLSQLTDDHPELVLIFQQTPDEYPAVEIERLFSLCPLARIVVIYGPWCEAAGRTRATWPAGLRVPSWLAVARVKQELQVLAGSAAALPWTTSREEAWVADQALRHEPDLQGLTVTLEIPDRAYRRLLTDLVHEWRGVITSGEMTGKVVIMDVEPWTPAMAAQVADCIHRHPDSRVLGVTGWVTPDVSQAATAVGVTHLVSKLDPSQLGEALQSSGGVDSQLVTTPG